MSDAPLRIVILGLSVTSSWGNGHATTYRSLLSGLAARGHQILFLERDVPWYANQRDLPKPPWCEVGLYDNLNQLKSDYRQVVADADLVMLGSYVPEGIKVGRWVLDTAQGVTAFYDIDTPVTLERLTRNDCEYLDKKLIPRFDLFLSFAGGPVLERLEKQFRARRALPLYCSVDPEKYYPETWPGRWDMAYMGTYSPDRQPGLESLLLKVARRWEVGRFAVVGPQFPEAVRWPNNVGRLDHLPPDRHRAFYNAQRFTLNLTRKPMVELGYSPSVRLFEAAACGVPVISDTWDGLTNFFEPDEEILLAESPEDVILHLRGNSIPESRAIGRRARERVLAEHTGECRARTLEDYHRLAATG